MTLGPPIFGDGPNPFYCHQWKGLRNSRGHAALTEKI
jgi:hypothetical protein